MTQRATLLLALLLALLQAQLWLGRGSIPMVLELENTLADLKQANGQMELRIARAKAELNDLKEGREMIEERARQGLGMVKPNEIFVQINR
jgi:cell division protein FtsB